MSQAIRVFPIVVLLLLPCIAQKQSADGKTARVVTQAAEKTPDAATRLPVRRVVLYKNGIGYFEHTARVRGTQDLRIDFTTGQLNDVLKSLTAVDTYNLKNLKRATIVGETTGGGAHPVSGHHIDDHFTIGVPSARAINPISKTNWEGVGVEPDVKVPAAEALSTAEKLAHEKLGSK